ncbi:MAG: hypothetical protein QM503_14710 [Bacteroidota bacterium]
MILNLETGKLPPNFYYLGFMLLAVGVWRVIVQDWLGILFLVISLILLFSKTGLLIDAKNSRLKKYAGIFMFKAGDWEDISSLVNLKIINVQETQSMHIVSISRSQTNEVYKLKMILPNHDIELLSGGKDYVLKIANEISSAIKTTVVDNTI